MGHQPDYGCSQNFHHTPHRGWHHHWICCTHDHVPQRFPAREETIEELGEYLKLGGVEERIAELKKEAK